MMTGLRTQIKPVYLIYFGVHPHRDEKKNNRNNNYDQKLAAR